MGCILFIVGAVLQACSYSLAQMTVGRLIVGFGIRSAAMIVPLYIAEVAPAKYHGRMIGLDNMSITGGQLIPTVPTGSEQRLRRPATDGERW